MHRQRWSQLFLAFSFFILCGAASAGESKRLVVFGDSLSDPGNAFVLTMDISLPPFELIPDAPYARGGFHFSNGRTWVEQLATRLSAGVSAGPALRKPLVFSNYAVGGARARAVPGTFDLGTQVGVFLRDYQGTAPGDALCVVYLGGNDVRDALQALATDPSGATSGAILQQALLATRDNLLALYSAGARRFLVPNLPNLALAPAVRLQGPPAQGAAQQLVQVFNTQLAAMLGSMQSSLGVPFMQLDVYTALNEVVAAPAAAGFSEVVEPCLKFGTKIKPYCEDADEYLFWDGIHPTRAGHQVLAERAGRLLGARHGVKAHAVAAE